MFNGRIDRTGYILGNVYVASILALLVVIYVIANVTLGSSGARAGLNITLYIFYVLYLVAIIPVAISLSVRRWHDIGQTGWLALLTFLPFVGGIVSIALCFIPGTDRSNNDGVWRSPRGFTGTLFGKIPHTIVTNPFPPPLIKEPVNPPSDPSASPPVPPHDTPSSST